MIIFVGSGLAVIFLSIAVAGCGVAEADREQAALERNIEREQEGIDRVTREIKQLKKDTAY